MRRERVCSFERKTREKKIRRKGGQAQEAARVLMFFLFDV
jgi:hypothetical protein